VEPFSSASWLVEFSHLDRQCFEVFLHRSAAQFPDELHLIQVDNAPAHTAKSLKILDNVILIVPPLYVSWLGIALTTSLSYNKPLADGFFNTCLTPCVRSPSEVGLLMHYV
jgi:hypothetical protein